MFLTPGISIPTLEPKVAGTQVGATDTRHRFAFKDADSTRRFVDAGRVPGTEGGVGYTKQR